MLIVTLAVFRDSLWMILSTWWLFISPPFHYFLYLQLNSCNGTLNAIEKTLSVRWNAFNVEMDQPISHCITQRAIQIHQREIKTECVENTTGYCRSLPHYSANRQIHLYSMDHDTSSTVWWRQAEWRLHVSVGCSLKEAVCKKIKNLKNASLLSVSNAVSKFKHL